MITILLGLGFGFFTYLAVGTFNYSRSDEAREQSKLFEDTDGSAKGWKAGAVVFTLLWTVLALACLFILITI